MTLEEYLYYERQEAAEEAAAVATAATIRSTTQENILELLEDLGEIPQDILDRINEEEDPAVLKGWLKKAARVQSFDEFRKVIFPMKQEYITT